LDFSNLEDLFGGDKTSTTEKSLQHREQMEENSVMAKDSANGQHQQPSSSTMPIIGGAGKTTLLGTKRLQNIGM
jgi:hypothetical protein